jgi:hypothetical protein
LRPTVCSTSGFCDMRRQIRARTGCRRAGSQSLMGVRITPSSTNRDATCSDRAISFVLASHSLTAFVDSWHRERARCITHLSRLAVRMTSGPAIISSGSCEDALCFWTPWPHSIHCQDMKTGGYWLTSYSMETEDKRAYNFRMRHQFYYLC